MIHLQENPAMTTPPSTMTVSEAIEKRRSVRHFTQEMVSKEAVDVLLAAAIRAPTAIHEEPWVFLIIQDAQRLQRLSEQVKKHFVQEAAHASLHFDGQTLSQTFAHPDFNVFYNASTLIVICADNPRPFAMADCWLAAENLMLAACSLGLGTCVIGSAQGALNTPEVKAQLGVPIGITAVAPIIVGIPAGETPASPRKPPRVLV
jgi:nitroreductase